jgi:hypothetical protein
MMFKTVLVALAALGSVSALPFKDPRSLHTGVRVIGLSLRSIEPEVPEIVVRGEHVINEVEKRAVPAEVATKSGPNKEIIPYKRDIQAVAEIADRDVEDFEERDVDDLEERDFEDVEERDIDLDLEERDEDEVEFEKRQDIYPEELPTKAENGNILPYNKRDESVPFHKRVLPLELAVRTNEHGEIVPY